ncbi:MAG: hypothetical protein NTY03_04890 [Candidatus Bathyarchaeota archaeon]|nr:hypothetical protein [Candidatus Bathyarchaeota archaeon]
MNCRTLAMPIPCKVTSLLFFVFLTITTIQGAVTYASIAYPPSPEQMFTNSDLVVTGTVLEVNCRWGLGNESIIITTVKLGVEGIAKGKLPERIIEVNIPGGKVGNLGFWMEDQPKFTVGEYVLLYLKSKSTPLNSPPQYTLTGETFFGKSYVAGNTTIGANGERVPIVIVATALGETMKTGSETPDTNDPPYQTDVIPASGILLTELYVPAKVYPHGETSFIEVSITASRMQVGLSPAAWVKSYPVSVNGNTTGVSIPVSLMSGESRTFNVTLEIQSPRDMMLNPFTAPSTHVDYTIKVGGIERETTVYAYPDYTYLYAGLVSVAVFASAILIVRARRLG